MEELWRAADNAKLFDPADRSIRNRGNVAMHDFFSEILRAADPPAQNLVEIGCAQSKWLPYFAKVHNLSVAGLDYSEIGCARARALLRHAECRGDIFQADIFDTPLSFVRASMSSCRWGLSNISPIRRAQFAPVPRS